MKIVMVSETLVTGGAEWFALRLSDALLDQGHEIYFYVIRPNLVNDKMLKRFAQIDIRSLPMWKVKLFTGLDRGMRLVGSENFFLYGGFARFLKKELKKYRPDVIHSHLIPSDETSSKANNSTHIRHVVTIHGDYIKAIKTNNARIIKQIGSFIDQLNKIVIISEEQKAIINKTYTHLSDKVTKIYNGYPFSTQNYPLKDQVFTFGMIARGIPEKGWEQSINAFLLLNQPNARLVFYAEGSYIDELKKKYTDSRILFKGFTDEPLKAIHNIDVGLLPSYYGSESLPTTVIEYLAMNKPVIATNVGEIKNMITSNGELAGIIIDEVRPDAITGPLHEAMDKLMNDRVLYDKLQKVCRSAFEKFSMQKCIDSYLKVYKS